MKIACLTLTVFLTLTVVVSGKPRVSLPEIIAKICSTDTDSTIQGCLTNVKNQNALAMITNLIKGREQLCGILSNIIPTPQARIAERSDDGILSYIGDVKNFIDCVSGKQ